MGTDYDLLRKNCCTFARDVCLRLGVQEEVIPTWVHNAAKAGAVAEDAIITVEKSVKNMFDCADEGLPIDFECYGPGFEVIAELKKGITRLQVVESPYAFNDGYSTHERQPLGNGSDHLSELRETISWTY